MTEAASTAPAKKWGPVRLQPGVSPGNMTVLILGFVFSMLFLTFIPQAQPLILNDVLHIPQSEQGAVTGYLGFAGTLSSLVTAGVWGTLSDRTGRRLVYALGLLLAAVGVAIYPLAASVYILYLFRMLFNAGGTAAQTMSNALLGDYVDNKDRGKAVGFTSMGGGIGALLTVFLFLRLPSMLQGGGVDAQAALRTTYWIVAVVGVAATAVIMTGLLGKSRIQTEQKRGLLQIVKDALQAARANPGISLAYGANFVASGAVTVLGTFFSLWIVSYGTANAGLSSAEALARGGMIMGISQMMGLIASPFFGILSDKINRVLAVSIATGGIAVVYLLTLLIKNPLDWTMIVLGIFLGLIQIGGLITGGALITQSSPEDVRGSVMGFYGFCGALGIMFTTLVGGQIFDRWMMQGPFVMIAVLCALVAGWGVLLYNRGRSRS